MQRASPSPRQAVSIGGTTVSVSPTADMVSGTREYDRPCSALHAGFTGTLTISCSIGEMAVDSSACVEKGCGPLTPGVSVTAVGKTKTMSVPTEVGGYGERFGALQ